mmetsp:Transcript_11653/g.15104  ORF Transcript_11653/g.15104 Transcript_11653/m.15104 type:complete len:139 (+) Transcript_11653:74-490(+)
MVRFSQIQRLNFLTIIFLCLTVQRTFSNQGVGFQQQESVEEFRKLFADFDQVDDGTTQTYSYNYLQTETATPTVSGAEVAGKDKGSSSSSWIIGGSIVAVIAVIGGITFCVCCRKPERRDENSSILMTETSASFLHEA